MHDRWPLDSLASVAWLDLAHGWAPLRRELPLNLSSDSGEITRFVLFILAAVHWLCCFTGTTGTRFGSSGGLLREGLLIFQQSASFPHCVAPGLLRDWHSTCRTRGSCKGGRKTRGNLRMRWIMRNVFSWTRVSCVYGKLFLCGGFPERNSNSRYSNGFHRCRWRHSQTKKVKVQNQNKTQQEKQPQPRH